MSTATRTTVIGFCTDPGPRETNQDAVREVLLPGEGWLLAVADGMGGLEAGEVASRLVLDVVEQRVTSGSPLGQAIRSANAALHLRADGEAMGTTLVAAMAEGARVRIASVGDSRAYYVDSLGISQITSDHTVAAEAAVNAPFAGDQVAATRWGGTLTRSLGLDSTVEVDEFGPMSLEAGSWLVLCTDGVYKSVPDIEIERCVAEGPDATAVAEKLVALALERGTDDNATAAVVQIPGPRTTLTGGKSGRAATTPWDPGQFLVPSGGQRYRKIMMILAALFATVLVVIVVASVILVK
ncbi:PP2C family protein-serine/threonine phosphatase [Gemmatimonadota bacterium]